ncbi:hypothetical protein BS78_01G183200 [Paspalum vaginatum]|nr:hypothetical protein BS78_01G183200 [Paspalum vaginatum]KAJ1294921.1 hypothetical protein BS78_01G183200 [Paspalum vaginatum]
MAKAAAMLVALALVVAAAAASRLLNCNVEDLEVCAPAFIAGANPTEECCANLRMQEPCYCQYAYDPVYGQYVNRPAVHVTIIDCHIAVPTC